MPNAIVTLPVNYYMENLGILGRSFQVQLLESSSSLRFWDATKGMKEKERKKEGRTKEGRESEFHGERNCEAPISSTLIFILTSMTHIFQIFSIKLRKKINFLCKAAFVLRLQFFCLHFLCHFPHPLSHLFLAWFDTNFLLSFFTYTYSSALTLFWLLASDTLMTDAHTHRTRMHSCTFSVYLQAPHCPCFSPEATTEKILLLRKKYTPLKISVPAI